MKHSHHSGARTKKAAQDTAVGCLEFAAADLARAALANTENAKRRLETSAGSWSSRAQLIQRLDDTFDVRRAAAKAEWNDGEAAMPGVRS